MKICPRCRAANAPDSQFCANCSLKLPVSVFKSLPLWAWGLISMGTLMLLTMIVVVSIRVEKDNRAAEAAKLAATPSPVPSPAVAPSATPTPPPEFAGLRAGALELLKSQKDEYVMDDLEPYNAKMRVLNTIPASSKDYKESQELQKKLAARMTQIRNEIQTLGERPSEADLYIAFNDYLRPRLNDYSSSEYVGYTQAAKINVKGQPFWVSILSLRAKNAFGAYILKDIRMYVRQKQVVLADGL